MLRVGGANKLSQRSGATHGANDTLWLGVLVTLGELQLFS